MKQLVHPHFLLLFEGENIFIVFQCKKIASRILQAVSCIAAFPVYERRVLDYPTFGNFLIMILKPSLKCQSELIGQEMAVPFLIGNQASSSISEAIPV